jgi:DNA-binding GntR family transcriptional regulator
MPELAQFDARVATEVGGSSCILSTVEQSSILALILRNIPALDPNQQQGVSGRMSMQSSAPILGDETAVHTFEPIKSPSLAETVLVHLRRAIINGNLPPGERLVETDLAEQFQVSRATIRQALHQLRFEGLVDVRPRRGAVTTRMSSKSARDVCTVRGLLEGWAARTACLVLTQEQLNTMQALSVRMGHCLTSGNIYDVVELDIEFHRYICSSDPNSRLNEHWESLNSLHGALMSSRLAFYNYDPTTVVGLHDELCAILAQRDPDRAEAAARLHYMGTRWEDDGED